MRLRDLEGFKDQGSLDALRGDWHAIQADPDNDLRDLTTKDNRAHIERLKDSLSTFGWRQGENMIVRVDESTTPPIVYAIDGKCRLVALEELEAEGRPFPGKVTVIQVQRGTDRKKRMLMILSSGSDRKNLSDIEFASGLYRSIEFGYTEQEVCDEMGWKAIGTLHNHLDVLTLKPELRKMVEEVKISRTEALRLQRMTPDADPGEIMQAAEEEHKRLNKKGPVKIKPRHTKAVTKPKAAKEEPRPKAETNLAPPAPAPQRTTPQHPVPEGATAAVYPEQEELDRKQISQAFDSPLVQPSVKVFAAGQQFSPHHAVKDLIKAIDPLAKVVPDLDPELPDDTVIFISDPGHEINAGQCRAAWKAWNAATGGSTEAEAA